MPTSNANQSVDALIVGAGPVGLTMAIECARHGLACRIIDKCPQASDKSKALVLWSRSLEMLDDMGAVRPFLSAGHPVHGVSMYSGGRRIVHLAFEIDSPFDYGLMIPQSRTERLLAEHLATRGLQVERSCELLRFEASGNRVTSIVRAADGREQSIDSSWLIGCDGAHSTVRHQLGLEFTGEAEPSDWLLADVQLRGTLPDDEVTIFFHASGVLVFFPIDAPLFRIVADLGTAHATQRASDPTLADVQQVIDERGPGGIRVSDPTWLNCFRINERKVADYRHGRVFLAGDAAHIHSPAGGQGMNTGMQDAYNLGWKLALAQAGRATDVLLDSYSTERSAIGDQVLRNAGLLTRAATLRNPVARQLRNLLYGFFSTLDVVRQRVSDTMSELAVNYRSGPITGEHRGLGASAWLLGVGVSAGDRAPDEPLIDVATRKDIRLFDVLRGTRHVLLLFTGVDAREPDAASLLPIRDDVRARFGGLIDVCVVASETSEGVTHLDPQFALHKRYGAGTRTMYLVRPDGYVGYRSQPTDAEGLLAHLSHYLR